MKTRVKEQKSDYKATAPNPAQMVDHLPKRKVALAPGVIVSGKLRFKVTAVWNLYKATIEATLRMMFQKPLVRGWGWGLTCTNLFMQKQMKFAFAQGSAEEARQALDALTFKPAEKPAVKIIPTKSKGEPRGEWYFPENEIQGRTVLYFHGGGYAFYSKSHTQMISLISEAAAARTFALDYRLAPEHPYPAQLEDAFAAYQWLLQSKISPTSIVLMGDSAGGHLALQLLMKIREEGLPQPALAIGLCPWTFTGRRGISLYENNQYDWVQGEQTEIFSKWLRGGEQYNDVEVSLFQNSFEGLAPIYLQAGDKEILVDMIVEFAEYSRRKGAKVTLDIWENMTHDFQAYGNMLPESREALLKIGAWVDLYTNAKQPEW